MSAPPPMERLGDRVLLRLDQVVKNVGPVALHDVAISDQMVVHQGPSAAARRQAACKSTRVDVAQLEPSAEYRQGLGKQVDDLIQQELPVTATDLEDTIISGLGCVSYRGPEGPAEARYAYQVRIDTHTIDSEQRWPRARDPWTFRNWMMTIPAKAITVTMTDPPRDPS